METVFRVLNGVKQCFHCSRFSIMYQENQESSQHYIGPWNPSDCNHFVACEDILIHFEKFGAWAWLSKTNCNHLSAPNQQRRILTYSFIHHPPQSARRASEKMCGKNICVDVEVDGGKWFRVCPLQLLLLLLSRWSMHGRTCIAAYFGVHFIRFVVHDARKTVRQRRECQSRREEHWQNNNKNNNLADT